MTPTPLAIRVDPPTGRVAVRVHDLRHPTPWVITNGATGTTRNGTGRDVHGWRPVWPPITLPLDEPLECACGQPGCINTGGVS